MKDLKKLKQLILDQTELATILQDYGAHFVYNPDKADEVQLRCPFHGDDRKPSARFYRETQSMYCWVCHKRWDVLGFIMEKENANFIQALKILERKYNIDISSIPDDPEFLAEKPVRSSTDEFEQMFFGDEQNISSLPGQKMSVSSFLKSLRKKRGLLSFKKYNALNYALHMIRYALSQGLDSSESLLRIETKLQSIQEYEK